jgi:hypothetical protein
MGDRDEEILAELRRIRELEEHRLYLARQDAKRAADRCHSPTSPNGQHFPNQPSASGRMYCKYCGLQMYNY